MRKNEFHYLVKEVIRECVVEGILPNPRKVGKSKPTTTMKRSELKERIKQFVRESIHQEQVSS